MAWLKADLAAVDRSRTPWLVVGMHAPWYNSNTAHQGEAEDMRRSMEALLYSYGVDLVFAGDQLPRGQPTDVLFLCGMQDCVWIMWASLVSHLQLVLVLQ